jgi:hypothetical protein
VALNVCMANSVVESKQESDRETDIGICKADIRKKTNIKGIDRSEIKRDKRLK